MPQSAAPAVLRALLNRAADPTARLPAAAAPSVLQSLTLLHDPPKAIHCAPAFAQVARAMPAAVADALGRIRVDANNAGHGQRVALLCDGLSRARPDEVVWGGVMAAAEEGLKAAEWSPYDVSAIVKATRRWGIYNLTTLPQAIEKYTAAKVHYAQPGELVELAAILCALPETKGSPMLLALIQRVLAVADQMTPLQWAALARHLSKQKVQNDDLCDVIVEQLPLFLDSLDGAAAGSVLSFWALHEWRGITAGTAAELVKQKEAEERLRQKKARASKPHRLSQVHDVFKPGAVGEARVEAEGGEAVRHLWDENASGQGLEEGKVATPPAGDELEEDEVAVPSAANEELEEGEVALPSTENGAPEEAFATTDGDAAPAVNTASASAAETAAPAAQELVVEKITPTLPEFDSESPEATLVALLQRLQDVLSVDDGVDSLIVVLRCLAQFGKKKWLVFGRPLDDLLDVVAVQIQELLALCDAEEANEAAARAALQAKNQRGASTAVQFNAGGAAQGVTVSGSTSAAVASVLSAETFSVLAPKFLSVVHGRPREFVALEMADAAAIALAQHAEKRAEELASAESPPFFLIPPLLSARPDECKRAALVLLREAQAQDLPLPTLQTFRFLLAMGDNGLFDREVTSYLRRSFSMTLDGIPLVQLAVALRCFAMAERAHPVTSEEHPDEYQEKVLFVSDVLAAMRRRAFRYDLRCLIVLARGLAEVGLDEEHHAEFSSQIIDAMLPLVGPANPSVYAKSDIVAVRTALEHCDSELPPEVLEFFSQVGLTGEEDDSLSQSMLPSKWMVENDPTGTILPRSQEQQQMDALLRTIADTRPSDGKRIAELAAQYLVLLDQAHPDEIRFLFEVFADKVIKQDKVLRDALAHLIAKGQVQQLSPYSIAAVLQSSAKIRFAYHNMTKQFLQAVTEEQWGLTDPVELEMTVAALARLGIRTPAILMLVSERALALAPEMTERQAAGLVQSLQGVGVHEKAVFEALLERLKDIAHEMSPLSLSMVFGGSQSHRLPFTEESAQPLVLRLAECSQDMSGHQKEQIGRTLRKTTLPRAMLSGATARMLAE